jgi:hypothetical protein
MKSTTKSGQTRKPARRRNAWREREWTLEEAGCRPCPCCGESRPLQWLDDAMFGLEVGLQSAMTYGVECCTCGLRMIREIPSDWPEDMPAGLRGGARMAWLADRTLRAAVAAWNRRPTDPPVADPG